MTSDTTSCASRLFNSPLEIGLRALIILAEVRQPCDLQRLIAFDYFLLHSGDLDDGPPSLHPPTPFRSGELLIKRELMSKGLQILISKGLISQTFDGSGIRFIAAECSSPFLDYFESPYAKKAREVAKWIYSNYRELDDSGLQQFVNGNIGQWGSEFINETLIEEETL